MRFAIARKGLFEVASDREVDFLALDHPDGIRDQAFVALGQQPNDVKHPAEGAGRVSPTAESEDVNLVTRLKCTHQELVGVCDIVGNSVAEREADFPCPPLAN